MGLVVVVGYLDEFAASVQQTSPAGRVLVQSVQPPHPTALRKIKATYQVALTCEVPRNEDRSLILLKIF